MLVVSPAKQIGVLVDNVAKVVTQGEERKAGVFWVGVVKFLEDKLFTFIPDENFVAFGEDGVLLIAGTDFFDLSDVFDK